MGTLTTERGQVSPDMLNERRMRKFVAAVVSLFTKVDCRFAQGPRDAVEQAALWQSMIE